MNKTIVVRLRVEPEFKTRLEDAIGNGVAESMSDLIRQAVDQLLARNENSTHPHRR